MACMPQRDVYIIGSSKRFTIIELGHGSCEVLSLLAFWANMSGAGAGELRLLKHLHSFLDLVPSVLV